MRLSSGHGTLSGMDEQLVAYNAGRVDGGVGCRDAERAAHPDTGADYRVGFLDGRIEVFHLLALIRKILDDAA